MRGDQIKTKVLEILGTIAPEADLTALDPRKNFRDQIDIDSIDYLNFVIALDEEFGANIPESDYTKFVTLAACVEEIEGCLERNAK